MVIKVNILTNHGGSIFAGTYVGELLPSNSDSAMALKLKNGSQLVINPGMFPIIVELSEDK